VEGEFGPLGAGALGPLGSFGFGLAGFGLFGPGLLGTSGKGLSSDPGLFGAFGMVGLGSFGGCALCTRENVFATALALCSVAAASSPTAQNANQHPNLR
jgi:hypothetical protein